MVHGAGVLLQVCRWPTRRWVAVLATAAFTVLFIAIPTDLIDTPLFARQVPPTAWAWPVLFVSAGLAGLVTATYVAYPDGAAPRRSEGRLGLAGWALYARLSRENSCRITARAPALESAADEENQHV